MPKFRSGPAGTFVVAKDLPALTQVQRRIADEFHALYYSRWKSGGGTIALSWLGVQTLKCPFDLWTYQEIICEVGPDLIVETGTAYGGSALYLASICDMVGRGRVISIDVNRSSHLPRHPRIRFLTGSSTSAAILREVAEAAKKSHCVLVILDSDHKKDHVLVEMRSYQRFVTIGSYLIVEDTNINGHPVAPGWGDGPMEAVQAFIAETNSFVIDETRERFLLTLNPNGFLKRIE